MQYVYILQSKKDDSFYVGTTEDLKQRLKNHNQHTSQYTKGRAPYGIVWYCGFNDKQKAFAFERYLKTGSNIAFFKKRLA